MKKAKTASMAPECFQKKDVVICLLDFLPLLDQMALALCNRETLGFYRRFTSLQPNPFDHRLYRLLGSSVWYQHPVFPYSSSTTKTLPDDDRYDVRVPCFAPDLRRPVLTLETTVADFVVKKKPVPGLEYDHNGEVSLYGPWGDEASYYLLQNVTLLLDTGLLRGDKWIGFFSCGEWKTQLVVASRLPRLGFPNEKDRVLVRPSWDQSKPGDLSCLLALVRLQRSLTDRSPLDPSEFPFSHFRLVLYEMVHLEGTWLCPAELP